MCPFCWRVLLIPHFHPARRSLLPPILLVEIFYTLTHTQKRAYISRVTRIISETTLEKKETVKWKKSWKKKKKLNTNKFKENQVRKL